jgi:peptidoglycan/xylan/chitin deacetylase (PgdA/CDA1 family)
MKQYAVNTFIQLLQLVKGWPFGKLFGGRVQILMFHRVVKDIGENRIINDGIEVTDKYLDFLIDYYLKNNFKPASINDLTDILNSKSNNRYVIFTFDDGYADNYENALPIFEKYQVPFTIYLTVDFIKHKQFAWWYFIEDLIRENTTIEYHDNSVIKVNNCDTLNCKNQFFIQLREIIQKQPHALAYLIEKYKPNLEKYYDLFLTMEHLKSLRKNKLVTLGAHSISHPSLAKVSDEQSFNEIYQSKIELEALLNKPIIHFSYPFGTKKDVGERELRNVSKAGYKTALTTTYGDVHTNNFDLLNLPRIWTANSIKGVELNKILYGINERSIRKKQLFSY